MKIRKTYINAYALCPAHFKKKYILRLPGSEEEGEQALLGKSFHTFANEFFNRVDWTELNYYTTISDVTQYMQSRFRQELDEAMAELKRLMLNFFDFEADHFCRVRSLGKQFFFPLEREYHIETDTLEGTIDRLDLLENGMVCPLEYKVTEHWKGKFWKTPLRRELVFYCILLNATKYRGKGSNIASYNPLMHKFFFEAVHRRTLASLASWVKRLQEALQKDDFPVKVSGLCRYCFDIYNCLQKEIEVPGPLMGE